MVYRFIIYLPETASALKVSSASSEGDSTYIYFLEPIGQYFTV